MIVSVTTITITQPLCLKVTVIDKQGCLIVRILIDFYVRVKNISQDFI